MHINPAFRTKVTGDYCLSRYRKFGLDEIKTRAREVAIIINHVFESAKQANAAWRAYQETGPMGEYQSLSDPVTNLADLEFMEDTFSGEDAYSMAVRRLSDDYNFDIQEDGFIFHLNYPHITELAAELFFAIGNEFNGNNSTLLLDFVCDKLDRADLPEDLSESHYVGLVEYALKVAG